MGLKSKIIGGTLVASTAIAGLLYANNDVHPFKYNPLFDNSKFPTLGRENAENVVIEIADFQCPYCAMASGLPEWVGEIRGNKEYGEFQSTIDLAKKPRELAEKGEVKFIYAPISALGKESTLSAEAVYCARDQGKFWEMHDAIYSAHRGMGHDKGNFSTWALEGIAAGIEGINSKEFDSCLESRRNFPKVKEATEIAIPLLNGGVPTLIVNGESVDF